jgi:signal transduction histidine kinase
MVVRRPSNRCGPVAIALGGVFAAWWIAALSWGAAGGVKELVATVLVYTLRPLLYYLVLAFPIGRLDRVSRQFLGWFVALGGVALVANVTIESAPGIWPSKPLVLLHTPTAQLVGSSIFWDVGSLFFAVAVLMIVWRRALRFRTEGSLAASPAVVAAAVAAGADIVLYAVGPIRGLFVHQGRLTILGVAVQLIDIIRWGVVAIVLGWGARRVWPKQRRDTGVVELGVGDDEALADALAHVLGGEAVTVAVRDDRHGWRDLAGVACPAPVAGPGTTFIDADGEAIAALQYERDRALHPAVVDSAVALLALHLESARQVAIAGGRANALRRLAVEVVDAEDAARRRLERDLHDGAQQTLVGLTLQAAIAARGRPDGTEDAGTIARALADAVDVARTELLTTATGLPPSLLVERGLSGALGALGFTAGLPVTVAGDDCDHLPEALRRSIWYTAAEAVTNALKHAHATRLELELRRRDGHVELIVRDDGRGGVVSPPATLAARTADAGGTLDVVSTAAGTTIRARYPLLAEVPA